MHTCVLLSNAVNYLFSIEKNDRKMLEKTGNKVMESVAGVELT